MDKLSEHAIRMLEIADKPYWNEYNMVNKDLKDTHDIARAVYDIILQVQMLKTALLHKTEPSDSEKPNNSTDKDINVRSKDCETCRYESLASYEGACDDCTDISGSPSNYEPKIMDTLAIDMAVAKCKARHNNCKNCDKKCIWGDGPQTEFEDKPYLYIDIDGYLDEVDEL